jgi:hypothetical protein
MSTRPLLPCAFVARARAEEASGDTAIRKPCQTLQL